MRYWILLALCFGLYAHAGKYHPIYNADFTYDADITSDKVEKAVKKSLLGRGWRVKAKEPGKITAKINLRAHSATVLITYGKGKIRIDYQKSTNLGYRQKKGEDRIHRNYNRWIQNLEQDISLYLVD